MIKNINANEYENEISVHCGKVTDSFEKLHPAEFFCACTNNSAGCSVLSFHRIDRSFILL